LCPGKFYVRQLLVLRASREKNMAEKIQQIQENPDKEKAQLKQRLSRIRHTIMVMSGKGGVGKSTVTANLAASLSLEGYRVGILDGDIHGPNIPKILGVEGQQLLGSGDGEINPIEAAENLKVVSVGSILENPDQPIIWRGPMKHSIMRHFLKDVNWGDLDFLVVDLPPGTGDEPLSIAQIIKEAHAGSSPFAIVVTTPQDVALLDSRKSVKFSRVLELQLLGIIENMSGMACRIAENPSTCSRRAGASSLHRNSRFPSSGPSPSIPPLSRTPTTGSRSYSGTMIRQRRLHSGISSKRF